MKKALLIGGNGAFGVYLTQELLGMGWNVDVVCYETAISVSPALRYLTHNGKDYEYMSELVKNEYDTIVDFMIYPTVAEFAPFGKLYLESTKHYVFLSSYRVYADACPITEESPRLLGIELPSDFVKEYEYSIYKAETEDFIRDSGYTNWTILRPSITYSKRRFQLTIFEADVFVWRMRRGKTVLLPESAMNVQGTLSWAGDFGKAVARLLLNPSAYQEAFTVGTTEHYTWREIADLYKEIGGLRYEIVDTNAFLQNIYQNNPYSKQQLLYDRCFNRIIDNSKLLAVTGLKQTDYMQLKNGLRAELAGYDGAACNQGLNAAMDAWIAKRG